MDCPKCGQQNPDDAPLCSSCGWVLCWKPSPASFGAKYADIKTSRLAVAALVFGILSIFTCALTAIPAIILGIVALVRIEKSGGILTGRGFAIVGIVVPVFSFILALGILMPVLARVRQNAFRTYCGTNLSGIGTAMLIYANDYDGKLPRAGDPNSKWGLTPNWQAENRADAYGLTDGAPGQASVSASLYLSFKYYFHSGPKSFVCRADSGTTQFIPDEYGAGNKNLSDLWDFGPDPARHVSYSYHMPYGPYPLTKSSDPGMAVMADRNPWIGLNRRPESDWGRFNTPDDWVAFFECGNAITHQAEGQNVLFMDGHVNFERIPLCGVSYDNIYTYRDGRNILFGTRPVLGSQPADKLDSLLVHDPPAGDFK